MSIDSVTKVYETTTKVHKEEKHGLVSQLNRASISMPINIAKGAGRNTSKKLHGFLSIAIWSVNEVYSLLTV